MRRRMLCLLVPLAAGASGCAARPGDAGTFTTADSTAVRTSGELWRSSSVARDFDAWARSVTSDVVLYPPNAKPVVGRDAAVAYIKAFPEITKFDIITEEVVGRGDAATDRGQFTLTARLPDGTVVNDTGSFLALFRRQPDGTWAHSRVMWNSNLPVPAPPSAPPAGRGTKGRD